MRNKNNLLFFIEKNWEPICLFLLASYYVYIRSNFFSIPMERDEGLYAYFGHLILDGKMPYVDFYETRFPGIFYMYAFLVAIFGDFEGLALGITVVNIGTLLFLYYFTKNLFHQNQTAAFVAVCAAAILGLAPQISGFTRQSEHIVVFWAMGGAYFLQKAFLQNNWKYIVLAGVFMCLAMLTKPNGVLFILMGGVLTVVFGCFYTGTSGFLPKIKKVILNGLIYSVSVFATFGLMCAYFLVKGNFAEFWLWSVTYANAYADEIPWDYGKNMFYGNFNNIFAIHYGFFVVAALGLLACVLYPSSKIYFQQRGVLLVVAAGFFLTVFPGYHFHGHYWLMMMPGVGLMIGAFVYVYQTTFGKKWLAGLVLAGFFLTGFVRHLSNFQQQGYSNYYTAPNHFDITRKIYGDNLFPETYEVGKYIKSIAQPSDKIALIGTEPQVFIYTNLPSVSKHAFFAYLMMDTLKNTNVARWQEEFYDTTKRELPRFIVYIHDWMFTSAQADRHFWGLLKNINEQILAQYYQKIGSVENAGSNAPVYIFGSDKLRNYLPAADKTNKTPFYIDIYELK